MQERAARGTLEVVPVGVLQDETDGLRDVLAIAAATGLMTAGHERQAAEGRDRHIAGVRPGAERTVLSLLVAQIRQAGVDGFLGCRRYHAACLVRVLLGQPAPDEPAGGQPQDGAGAADEEFTTIPHAHSPSFLRPCSAVVLKYCRNSSS